MKTSKLEKLSHYAIIVIALSALVVSVMQTRIQHNHNKQQVTPKQLDSICQNSSLHFANILNFDTFTKNIVV